MRDAEISFVLDLTDDADADDVALIGAAGIGIFAAAGSSLSVGSLRFLSAPPLPSAIMAAAATRPFISLLPPGAALVSTGLLMVAVVLVLD